jgi:hypothetical protein
MAERNNNFWGWGCGRNFFFFVFWNWELKIFGSGDNLIGLVELDLSRNLFF